MTDLILDQFRRLLVGLDPQDPWPALTESGFLNLLRSEDDDGAGLDLTGLFPLVIELGRQTAAPAIAQTIIARLVSPDAIDCPDPERALIAANIEPATARAVAATVTAGLMAGAMERLVEMTVDYALTRRQFGREIGKFQALQQQIALMAEESVAARMAAAAAFVGAPLDIPVLRAAVAKMRCGTAMQVVCSVAHAVHGAIGISHEYSLHRLTGRLHSWRMAHGAESYWARRIGVAAITSDLPIIDLLRAV
jgi:alkylation response protein AidB-like acyl-CoA dehydrogenase